jgi:hypothetical protein
MKSALFIVLLNFFIFDSLYASYDDIEYRIAAFQSSNNSREIYELGIEIWGKAEKSSEDQKPISPNKFALYQKAYTCFSASRESGFNESEALHYCGMINLRIGNSVEAEFYLGQAVLKNYKPSESELDKLEKRTPPRHTEVNKAGGFKDTLKVMGPVCLAFASDLTIDAIAHASRVLLGPGWGMFTFALIESRHTIPYWSSLQPYAVIAISRIILGSVIENFS